MDMSEEFTSLKSENASGPSKARGMIEVINARLQAQMWDIPGMPNFLMTMHKDDCAICQSYAEHVLEALKGTTIPILHPQIANMFHSAWPQSVAIIEDDTSAEADHKCNWYCDQCDDWAKRAKFAENKLSLEIDQCCKVEIDLEASKSKEASLEKELKELCKELKWKEKHNAFPAHPLKHTGHHNDINHLSVGEGRSPCLLGKLTLDRDHGQSLIQSSKMLCKSQEQSKLHIEQVSSMQ